MRLRRSAQEPCRWRSVPAAQPASPIERFRIQNRAGWRRWEKGPDDIEPHWHYFLIADGLNEALAGLAPRESRNMLASLGYIVRPKPADRKHAPLAAVFTVPNHGKVRLYRIGAGRLASADGVD